MLLNNLNLKSWICQLISIYNLLCSRKLYRLLLKKSKEKKSLKEKSPKKNLS